MGNKKTPKLCSYTAQTLDYHLLLACVFMGTDTWCDTWVQCFNTVCLSLHVAVDFWSSTKIETPERFWQLPCVKARASGCEAKCVCTIKVLLSHPLFCIPHLIWYIVMLMWTLTGWITAVTSKLPCVSNVQMLLFFYWPFCLWGRLFTDLCVRKTRSFFFFPKQ